MKRIKLILVAAVTIVAVVLVFALPAMAMSPRGTIGEGRTDIKEGHHFIEAGLQKGSAREVQHGNQVIREGHLDIRQGQSQLR